MSSYFSECNTPIFWINYKIKIISRSWFTSGFNLSLLTSTISRKFQKFLTQPFLSFTYLMSLEALTISLWLAKTALTSSLRMVSTPAIWAGWPLPPDGALTPPYKKITLRLASKLDRIQTYQTNFYILGYLLFMFIENSHKTLWIYQKFWQSRTEVVFWLMLAMPFDEKMSKILDPIYSKWLDFNCSYLQLV